MKQPSSPKFRIALDRELDREVDARISSTEESSRNARRALDRHATRRPRLLDAYLSGGVSIEDFQPEQSAIQAATRAAERQLLANEEQLREGRRRVDVALDDLKPQRSRRDRAARRHRIFEAI